MVQITPDVERDSALAGPQLPGASSCTDYTGVPPQNGLTNLAPLGRGRKSKLLNEVANAGYESIARLCHSAAKGDCVRIQDVHDRRSSNGQVAGRVIDNRCGQPVALVRSPKNIASR
jgi:hypothetical protein